MHPVLADTGLPILDALPALAAALSVRTAAVLQAPPGAGKTTLVPLALLEERWLGGGRIVMLEPRRLAARAAARRMATLLGESVGETIGHRVRLDARVGPGTRIEVVTEGILTRRLQSDPGLEGVGLVIFDEFHERSLHADLGLALALESQAVLRPELRILVMSATLDGAAVAALLADARVVTSEGRAFPVELRYRPRRPDAPLEPAVASAVREALAETGGDVLAFLPGAGEIRRAEELLAGASGANVDVRPLHGNLGADAQDAAIAPAAPGRRKVVLATSIAETSLTIEGVRAVVDGGLARVSRFSPRTGMTRLETIRVSRAAAEQRAGRAGRLGPGVCYRLWSAVEQETLVPHPAPEILEADLAPLALELAVAGVADPAALRWLDPPPAAAYAQARELLRELEALDASGRVTAHGRAMARLALHPRLAHMALRALDLSLAGTACELAALLEERDVLRGHDAPPDADLRLRLELLGDAARSRGRAPPLFHGFTVDRDALRRVRLAAEQHRREIGVPRGESDEVESAGVLLALAYPDRVAQRRAGAAPRYLLRNGLGAALGNGETLAPSPWLVAAELDGRGRESRIRRAAPIAVEDVERLFGGQIADEERVEWDDATGAARARRFRRLGAIVLAESAVAAPDRELIARAALDTVRRRGLGLLPWTDAAIRLRERLAFLHALDPAWPGVSDAALAASLEEWLLSRLRTLARPGALGELDLAAALLDRLDWRDRARLDELAPTHVTVPSGSRLPIDYSDPAAPALAVRLQEMFGLEETPRVGGGRVALTLHLLSPAGRPVQVTRDLAGFWRNGYFDVRKDLRGRYPKHRWPDDPLTAAPTRRARRRGE